MTLLNKKILDDGFKNWIEGYGDNINDFQIKEYKYIWFVDEVLNLITYSTEISIEIGDSIIDVCKYILVNTYKNLSRTLDERINYKNEWYRNDTLLKDYCLYLNLLIDYLDWGINIYNAWFDQDKVIIINEVKYKLNKLNLETLFLWIDGYE